MTPEEQENTVRKAILFFKRLLIEFKYATAKPTAKQSDYATLEAQIIKLMREVSDLKIRLTFSSDEKEDTELAMKILSAKHRLCVLEGKRLKICDCGKDHTEHIIAIKSFEEIYSEQLLKFTENTL